MSNFLPRFESIPFFRRQPAPLLNNPHPVLASTPRLTAPFRLGNAGGDYKGGKFLLSTYAILHRNTVFSVYL